MNLLTTLPTSMLVFSLLLLPVQASWTLDEQASSVHFISVKKAKVAEIHHFKAIAGSIDNTGQVTLEIDLTSVETGVDIRNERMENYLFETERFTQATVTANLDPATIHALKAGHRILLTQALSLDLHGEVQPLEAQLILTRLANQQLTVQTQQPLLIDAAAFNLVEGINQLAELVSLPSISTAVPLTVDLVFVDQD